MAEPAVRFVASPAPFPHFGSSAGDLKPLLLEAILKSTTPKLSRNQRRALGRDIGRLCKLLIYKVKIGDCDGNAHNLACDRFTIRYAIDANFVAIHAVLERDPDGDDPEFDPSPCAAAIPHAFPLAGDIDAIISTLPSGRALIAAPVRLPHRLTGDAVARRHAGNRGWIDRSMLRGMIFALSNMAEATGMLDLLAIAAGRVQVFFAGKDNGGGRLEHDLVRRHLGAALGLVRSPRDDGNRAEHIRAAPITA